MIKALLVMLLWGSLYPMVKLGYEKFGVRTANTSDLLLFAGVRFFLCGGIVSLFCAAKKRQSIERTKRGWSAVLLVALFSVALHYSFTYIGRTLALITQEVEHLVTIACTQLAITGSIKVEVIRTAGAIVRGDHV